MDHEQSREEKPSPRRAKSIGTLGGLTISTTLIPPLLFESKPTGSLIAFGIAVGLGFVATGRKAGSMYAEAALPIQEHQIPNLTDSIIDQSA